MSLAVIWYSILSPVQSTMCLCNEAEKKYSRIRFIRHRFIRHSGIFVTFSWSRHYLLSSPCILSSSGIFVAFFFVPLGWRINRILLYKRVDSIFQNRYVWWHKRNNSNRSNVVLVTNPPVVFLFVNKKMTKESKIQTPIWSIPFVYCSGWTYSTEGLRACVHAIVLSIV